MNKKLYLPALLLAATTTAGFMLPGTAAARDNHVDKREVPVQFVHYDRYRHDYRQHRPQPVPRWMHQYQRHHAYGHDYRPGHRHPGFFADKHALKHYYRRMERDHHRHDRRHSPGYGDSNIHFRIDYWD